MCRAYVGKFLSELNEKILEEVCAFRNHRLYSVRFKHHGTEKILLVPYDRGGIESGLHVRRAKSHIGAEFLAESVSKLEYAIEGRGLPYVRFEKFFRLICSGK